MQLTRPFSSPYPFCLGHAMSNTELNIGNTRLKFMLFCILKPIPMLNGSFQYFANSKGNIGFWGTRGQTLLLAI
jgi:hypothetical protein